jgi:hypothetical protein
VGPRAGLDAEVRGKNPLPLSVLSKTTTEILPLCYSPDFLLPTTPHFNINSILNCVIIFIIKNNKDDNKNKYSKNICNILAIKMLALETTNRISNESRSKWCNFMIKYVQHEVQNTKV